MSTVRAIGAHSATDPLVPLEIERRAPGPDDVLIAIRYAGICHSDIHFIREEWGRVTYPQVVGHEIAGEVVEVGANVAKFSVGERVGVGCMVNSCRECDNCRAGMENYCLNGNTQTFGSVDADGTITQGGYSTHVVVDQDFVLHVPDALPFDKVAPLLCAGITTYSPLAHWNVGPGSKVAVVGLGGLGHLAVKIAVTLGAEVTVLSQTLSKSADGEAFGAAHFYATSDASTFETLANSFDLILNTVSAELDLNAYLGLLRLDGTMVNVGAPAAPLPLSVFTLFGNRRSFAGSGIGSIAETQEMLEFCAEHGVVPETELIGAGQVNEAYKRVLNSDVRYRFVIDVATI